MFLPKLTIPRVERAAVVHLGEEPASGGGAGKLRDVLCLKPKPTVNDNLAVLHGSLRLGRYDAAGRRLDKAGAAA